MKKTGGKFKYIEGRQAAPLNECYGGVRAGVSSADCSPLKVSRAFFALPWHTAGTIAVQSLAERGNGREDRPLVVVEEGGACQDLDWSPFEAGLLASAWEDGAARLHRIPESGLESHLIDATATLQGHEKRLNCVLFHPYVQNVLLTADTGSDIKLWDVEASAERVTLSGATRGIYNASWSMDSSMLATSGKDKTLRVWDARAGQCVGSAPSHQGTKGGRVIWLGRIDRIATVGISRGNAPELILTDPRNLSAPLQTLSLTGSTATLFPFWDDDLGLLYIAGKGEGSIRVFEVSETEAVVASEHKHKDPIASLAMLPKQGVVVSAKCEVARFLKLVESRRMVVPLHFEVPRQASATVFQEDLYPALWDRQPVYQASEWFGGAAPKTPTLVPFQP